MRYFIFDEYDNFFGVESSLEDAIEEALNICKNNSTLNLVIYESKCVGNVCTPPAAPFFFPVIE